MAASSMTANDGFDLAITVDDLPNHGALPIGTSRLQIANSYLSTLKAHHVPEAYGFVNAKGLVNEPGTEAVLNVWRKAGYPLGNHTYSHMDLAKAPSLRAWLGDVEKGEPAVAQRMAGSDWRVLRYPYLSAGAGERHDEAVAYLRAHDYRVAEVTLSFSDWAYTDPYLHCLARGDAATIAALKKQYLEAVDVGIARMKLLSRKVYGRIISQVILMHIGGWSAMMLPQVMDKLDAAGARYVTLATAESDPAYTQPASEVGKGAMMERDAKRLKIDLSGIPAEAPIGNLMFLGR